MKKKIIKKLLFYVILLLITFCISHFVNADDTPVNYTGGDITPYTNAVAGSGFVPDSIGTNMGVSGIWGKHSYVFDKANVSVSGGSTIYYGLSQITVALTGTNIKPDTWYRLHLEFYVDSNISSDFSTLNYSLACGVYNGSWNGTCDSLSAVGKRINSNTLTIDVFVRTTGAGTGLAIEIGNNRNYDLATSLKIMYNTSPSSYQGFFLVDNTQLFITNDITGELNNISGNINETNNKLDNINSSLTDSSPISLDKLNDTTGWLPPGPVDSILNLPLSLLNNLSTNLNNQCTPISLTIPFIDRNNTLVLPCLANTLSENVEGFDTFYSWLGLIVSCLLLYRYLMSLYVWVDNALMLRLEMYEDYGGKPTNFGSV